MTLKEPLIGDPFAAFHVRRGDKTGGYVVGTERVIEGESTPPSTYLRLLRRNAPDIRTVFVMTDDYRVVDGFRIAYPQYDFVSTCLADARGYHQDAFAALNVHQKELAVEQLLVETSIAARSALFLGGFKSNVSRFVPLWHTNPEVCLSVDGMRRWSPV
jgi:hypothetical protein